MSTLETPWGPAEHTKDIGGGILRVDTPSHGGYFVPPALNVLVPSIWRESSFNKQAMNGWYEEDCDWFMVALTFPMQFPKQATQPAEQARKWFTERHNIAA